MNVRWSDIPGYREAVKREGDIREAAFLDLTTSICGVEIRQMTPRDLLILDGIGNSLVSNGLPTPEELADFLWKLSPKFKLNAPFRRWIFWESIRKLNYLHAVKACANYVDDTFQDSPASSSDRSLPYAAWTAYIVNNIAMNYGWSESSILNIPLKRLFQYLRCIRRYHDPNAPLFNPSDKLKGDYVRKLVLDAERRKLVNVLKRRLN